MINQQKPTTHSRHIDVQFFAIQDWCRPGDIVMKHIAGILNMTDYSTKHLVGFYTIIMLVEQSSLMQ